MASRWVRRARLQVEALESRWMPATLVSPTQLTYHDVDADPVRVTFSKPILTSLTVANDIFTFSNGNVDNSDVARQQLWKIDLSGIPGAAGTDITVELNFGTLGGGDFRTNVGFINAEGINLGKVIVRGDLGRLVVGDGSSTTPALEKLRVASMGVEGLTTQESGGSLESNVFGPAGKIVVKETLQHANLVVRDLGLLRIDGSLIGGSQSSSGMVNAFGSIGEVRVGVNIQGDAGTESGSIFVSGPIGDITIGGSVTGGTGAGSGRIIANGSSMGIVHVGGSLLGGVGRDSAVIGASRKLGGINVLGDVLGGVGNGGGTIYAFKTIGFVSIGGNLEGGGGEESGVIRAIEGKIQSIDIGGSLLGSGGNRSGWIDGARGLGSLTLGSSLIGSGGDFSGRVESSGGSIGDINIGGVINPDGNGAGSACIAARDNLGNIVVNDGIFGFADFRVVISAGGVGSDGPATIGSITVIGEMNYADILAGYNAIGAATPVHAKGDARIGKVMVTGTWVASNLVAGVDRGADGYFGTKDDDDNPIGSSSFISKIGPITIGGTANGTAGAGDHFGIMAEQVKALAVNGVPVVLNPGPLNDLIVALGITGDFVLHEVKA